MSHIIKISIPIWETLLCLSYGGAAKRLKEVFPEVEFGDWYEVGEYARLVKFLSEHQEIPFERKELMLAQMRTKHISNGPNLHFSMPASDGSPAISGSVGPWRFVFRREKAFVEKDKVSIVNFLKSLGIGDFESYSEEEEDSDSQRDARD